VGEALELLGVPDDAVQQFLQLFVADHLVLQVGQPGAQLEQLAQGVHLVHDLHGLEVLELGEVQLHSQQAAGVAELVLHFDGKPGGDAAQDIVEGLVVHVDELAVLELLQGLLGMAAVVAEDAQHERELLGLGGAADLDVVHDLHAGRPVPGNLLLGAFFGHGWRSFLWGCGKLSGSPWRAGCGAAGP